MTHVSWRTTSHGKQSPEEPPDRRLAPWSAWKSTECKTRNMVDLRRARERVGLTQTEMAAQLNISQSMVSRYETNVGQAPFDLVVRWLSACGTDLATAIREFANTVDRGGGLDPGRPYELLDRDLILIERHIKTVLPESLTAMTPGAPNPKKLEELFGGGERSQHFCFQGRLSPANSALPNSCWV